MKVIRISIMFIAMLGSLSCVAQTHITKSISALQGVKEVTSNSDVIKNPRTKHLEKSQQTYVFSLPLREKSVLTDLQQAFDADAEDAYRVMNGGKSRQKIMVNDKYIGQDYTQYKLLCFDDPADTTYRWAYSLEWTPDSETTMHKVVGRVMAVYGVKPVQPSGTLVFPDWNKGDVSKGGMLNLFPQDSTLEYREKLTKYIERAEELRRMALKSREYNDSLIRQIRQHLKNGESSIYLVDNNNQSKYRYAQELTSEEWDNLLSKEIKQVEKGKGGSITSVYISTIYNLCKNHPAGITSTVENKAKDKIKSLIPKAKDDFSKTTLQECLDFLK